MLVSLVGTRFEEAELSRTGRLLLIHIELPNGLVEAVVSIVTHERTGEEQRKRWLLGVETRQISDEHGELLAEYLERRRTTA
jgi:hypothetical protein